MSPTITAPNQPIPEVSRRTFLASLAASTLVIAAGTNGNRALAWAMQDADDNLPFEPNLFIAIDTAGAVTILAHRSEMGTGIKTSLPMVVADELGADWDRVTIKQAIGDARLGSQNTDGSRSIRRFYEPMRIAGATARTMLERAAAQRWNVSPDECKGRDHQVVHEPTNRTINFGDLVADAKSLETPSENDLKFKPKSEHRYIGRDIPIADLDDIVKGSATFGLDLKREGMLYAVIARSPVLGGQPIKVEVREARQTPGVVDIITLPDFTAPHAFQPLGGVAVIATSTWAAIQGREALKIEWSKSDHDTLNSKEHEATLATSARTPGRVVRKSGDAPATIANAQTANIHEADYYVPMLSHAPMEPPCAVAEVTKNAAGEPISCEAWAPTQNPQAAQSQVAQSLGIQPERVTVNVTLLGGGFGRKSKPDYVAEAALLSSELDKPVQVTWTREDDIQHDYYHTNAAMHMQAVVKDDGLPTAWLQRSAFPSIMSTFNPAADEGSGFELALGFTDIPYDVPNLQVENGKAEAHVRIGWLRSVAHIYHAFAVCSFPDELARRANRDPYEYLMDLMGEPRNLDLTGVEYPNHGEPLSRYPFEVGRLRHVTQRAAKLANWPRKLPKGRGLGIASHRSFLSYCATVVEVDISESGSLSIPNVWTVIDAGLVVNPDRVHAQLEGAAVFGASLTMHGEITATNGAIDQSNFHDYRVARMNDAPKRIHTEIIESDALPAGVGEVGVPPFAPALCNAIADATGLRIRRLPLSKHDLSWNG